MASESNVRLTIHFNDPDLDAEERDEESRKLLAQLRDLDGVETAERVLDPNPPEGNKALAGFLTDMVRTEAKPTNLRLLFGFLGNRPGYTPIEMEVEVSGRRMKIKANSREELMAAWQLVQQFIEEDVPTQPAPTRTILILAANPRDISYLRLDQEVRDISAGLERATYRDRFSLKSLLAVRPRDLQRAMLDHNPQIVHFCGHGIGTTSNSGSATQSASAAERKAIPVDQAVAVEGLAFEDDTGKIKLIDAASLANLLKLFADQVECVVLNACYSQMQAKAIAQHINYVIGMNREIGDRAAIEFAVGFYDALGAGRPVEFAYELACSAIQLAGIPEHLTPVLEKKP